MQLIRTLLAAATVALASSAHAGLVGQSVGLFTTGTFVAGQWNNSAVNQVVGNQVEVTHTQLQVAVGGVGGPPQNLAFGDGYLAIDLTDNSLNIEYSPGDSGTITGLIFTVLLEDANSYFTNLTEMFDGAGLPNISSSPNGWSYQLVDVGGTNRALTVEISGLQLGDPNFGRSHGASFGFDVVTAGTTPPGTGTDVPEPASLALVGAALAGLAASRRRSGKA